MVKEDIEAIEHPALFMPLIYIYIYTHTHTHTHTHAHTTHTHTHTHTHTPQAEGNSDGRPGKSAQACLTQKKSHKSAPYYTYM